MNKNDDERSDNIDQSNFFLNTLVLFRRKLKEGRSGGKIANWPAIFSWPSKPIEIEDKKFDKFLKS